MPVMTKPDYFRMKDIQDGIREIVYQYDALSPEQQKSAIKTIIAHPDVSHSYYEIAHHTCTIMEKFIKKREEDDYNQRKEFARASTNEEHGDSKNSSRRHELWAK